MRARPKSPPSPKSIHITQPEAETKRPRWKKGREGGRLLLGVSRRTSSCEPFPCEDTDAAFTSQPPTARRPRGRPAVSPDSSAPCKSQLDMRKLCGLSTCGRVGRGSSLTLTHTHTHNMARSWFPRAEESGATRYPRWALDGASLQERVWVAGRSAKKSLRVQLSLSQSGWLRRGGGAGWTGRGPFRGSKTMPGRPRPVSH